jgi:hypothetical protein
MREQLKVFWAKCADPRVIRWLITLLSIVATVAGIGACPDILGGCGGG